MDINSEVQAVYKQLLDAWINRNARGMADLFTESIVSKYSAKFHGRPLLAGQMKMELRELIK